MSRYPNTNRPHPKRVVLDERGNPCVEREIAPGEFTPDVDTKQLRSLNAGDLNLLDTLKMKRPSFNPYDTTHAASPQLVRRRTLDDLRRLSEEIKRLKEAKQADGA